ncbi:MAG TPA: hypothetical protein GX405_09925 [Rhizobiales bacterium]|nr:hypothetical protein [Hyphomicrobiales bacterium]
MPRYNPIALTNAGPGHRAEFDHGDTRVHLADAPRLAGVVAAHRFRMSDTQDRPDPFEYACMAVHETDINGIGVPRGAWEAVSGTDRRPLSPGLASQRIVRMIEPITGRVERPKG